MNAAPSKKFAPTITLVGHPFSPIGTGRALRLTLAACRNAGIDVKVRDVWKASPPDASFERWIKPLLTDQYGDINIFHINGDEIERTLGSLGGPSGMHNIVVPFWELPRYPSVWVNQLQRFDEIWASSLYIRDSIKAAVDKPVVHMPLATEISFDQLLQRRYFKLPENSYIFLFFFDCRSYISRKNPQAVVDAFRGLLARRPWARTTLVIKLQGSEIAPEEAKRFIDSVVDLRDRVVIIPNQLPEGEVHNLIRCADAFVSLHRAEGYGLGLAEAMFLGLPAIGTAHSGNMDFMTIENSLLVDYRPVPVPDGAYPHFESQTWADPDIQQATDYMTALFDDPRKGRRLGELGSRHIRTHFSLRAAGQRYRKRISEIIKQSLGADEIPFVE